MAKILDISTEGVVVFDYIPTDSAVDSYPLVVISADSDVISTTPLKIGSCYAMQPGGIDYEVPESLGVVGVVVQYLSTLRGVEINDLPPSTPVTLIAPPKHGKFIVKAPESPGGWPDYQYVANKDFRGQKDSFTVRIEIDGELVDLVMFIHVVNLGDDAIGDFCSHEYGKGIWKISPDSSASLFDTLHFTFSDLPGTAVAQATGTNASAQITLDTNAAGYGWFIDYTPYLNEEWLPTSNPYEWQAKPGSEAEGKMDMLSVLLHEYGHTLGLEHSSDSHDFMTTTLQPGMRRLPTAEEWAHIASLAPELTGIEWLGLSSSS
jgi:hypothetical protein